MESKISEQIELAERKIMYSWSDGMADYPPHLDVILKIIKFCNWRLSTTLRFYHLAKLAIEFVWDLQCAEVFRARMFGMEVEVGGRR